MKQIAKLSGKYQTTIPASVRRALGLHPGDRLAFELSESDARPVVTIRRYPTLDEVAGTVPVPPDVRGLSWSEIRERAWTGSTGEESRRSTRR
jgi:AbrB family looped-hinge helix DNA binding protein